jgi:hypothetical protein
MQISTSAAHIAAQAAAGIQRPQATPRRVETSDFVDLAPSAPSAKLPAPLRDLPTTAAVAGEGAGRRESPVNQANARLTRPGSLLDIKV